MRLKNKKGAMITVGMVVAIFLAVVFFFFLLGGGISASWNFAKIVKGMVDFMKSIPRPIWVILGIIILFKIIGGKK